MYGRPHPESYDALSRLKTVNYGDGQTSFDAMGYRLITSDADGNTLTDTGGGTNTWDSQNRLGVSSV